MVRQALLHVLPDWRSRVALYRFASLIIASIVRGVLCVAFARSRACSKSAAAGLQPPTQDVSSTLHNLQAETLECGQRLTRANQLHFRLGAIGLIVMDIQVSCDDGWRPRRMRRCGPAHASAGRWPELVPAPGRHRRCRGP